MEKSYLERVNKSLMSYNKAYNLLRVLTSSFPPVVIPLYKVHLRNDQVNFFFFNLQTCKLN